MLKRDLFSTSATIREAKYAELQPTTSVLVTKRTRKIVQQFMFSDRNPAGLLKYWCPTPQLSEKAVFIKQA